MAGISVSLAESNGTTVASWRYTGKRKLQGGRLSISRLFRDVHDAQSFALAGLLPLVAVTGESITFDTPYPRRLAEFWAAKMAPLKDFYLGPMSCDIRPLEDIGVERVRGDDVAILMGCGADSLSTLGLLMDRGVFPQLVLIQERQTPECYEGGLRTESVRQLAEDYGLRLHEVESNLWFFGRDYLAPFLRPEGCQILRRRHDRFATNNILRGFQMFFSTLPVLHRSIGELVVGSSLDDRSEWFGMGFLYQNEIPYRGLRMVTEPWATKVEQYDYLHKKRPDLIKYQKTCVTPFVRWCGKCFACVTARCMQLAVGQEPVKATNVKCFDRSCVDMLHKAYLFSAGRPEAVRKEILDRMTNTTTKKLREYAMSLPRST